MQKQNSAFAARSKTASTKALVTYGGNVCESNTSKTFCTPRNGFEDRGAHRSPSVPKCGGILPNRAANLAQGAQAAGFFVEYRKAHGIQVLQDTDGSLARHTKGLAQSARGGSTAG